MAAILYDAPQDQHAIEGRALVQLEFRRSGSSPSVRLLYREGYYDGLNDCGFGRWVEKGLRWERVVPFADATLQTLCAAHGLDLAALDDQLVSVANELLQILETAPPEEPEVLP